MVNSIIYWTIYVFSCMFWWAFAGIFRPISEPFLRDFFVFSRNLIVPLGILGWSLIGGPLWNPSTIWYWGGLLLNDHQIKMLMCENFKTCFFSGFGPWTKYVGKSPILVGRDVSFSFLRILSSYPLCFMLDFAGQKTGNFMCENFLRK